MNNFNLKVVCYNKDSFKRIKTLCEGEKSCLIYANTNTFGDPCGGLNKQLFVQYQCLSAEHLERVQECPIDHYIESVCPPVTTKTKKNSEWTLKSWCEPTNAQIAPCPQGQTLNINCAMYGIDPILNCPGNFLSLLIIKCEQTVVIRFKVHL
jgi:hypothetical protein